MVTFAGAWRMNPQTLERLKREIAGAELFQSGGKLRSSIGVLLTSSLRAAVGEQCDIVTADGRSVAAEVVGFNGGATHLVPYESTEDVRPGMGVTSRGRRLSIPVGRGVLGRVMDGLGRPIDGRGPLVGCELKPVRHDIPAAMERTRIRKPFVTGQRAIDGLLTCGLGQRLGIFAGSGVGKSTLLGEIAKQSSATLNVIALIGERGREVRAFLEDSLGAEGLARSAVVVATSDQSPLMRVRAAQAAITLAEYFRGRGVDVLFMLDSLTRLAMAQRELGLALGEPPSGRGYTPSVFQLLAATLERLGTGARGSITGLLTVLVDGGDLDEPVSDAVRAIVDGHIVLDRRLAERGHYPAINISQSVSRVAGEVTDAGHQNAARKFRAIQATYAEVEDLIRIGAYVRGSNPQVDRAIELRQPLDYFLKQLPDERTAFADTREALERIAGAWPY
jgi:flagellum-specific ATP synthase